LPHWVDSKAVAWVELSPFIATLMKWKSFRIIALSLDKFQYSGPIDWSKAVLTFESRQLGGEAGGLRRIKAIGLCWTKASEKSKERNNWSDTWYWYHKPTEMILCLDRLPSLASSSDANDQLTCAPQSLLKAQGTVPVQQATWCQQALR